MGGAFHPTVTPKMFRYNMVQPSFSELLELVSILGDHGHCPSWTPTTGSHLTRPHQALNTTKLEGGGTCSHNHSVSGVRFPGNHLELSQIPYTQWGILGLGSGGTTTSCYLVHKHRALAFTHLVVPWGWGLSGVGCQYIEWIHPKTLVNG